ncbi:TetR/AcrR family transcriptional regulator [Tindallia californiensis]|uniref:DNA-binding transcriptional regulator, AcrR family n=1 Tax=Tindallia californiensis TaxID=159292 RepID=A0A1H3LGL4_9FIRM|nr:TetR/AcrR family transcriptional regulator [Tindallia californiensis]SDY63602.1 DNA-binding transcriptional regulator, AcrR family [Tindallia californiensis]
MATQAERKYYRLLEQAERLFVSRGLKNVTMEEVASAAGISKMTIYNHFDSKEHLVEFILMEMVKRFNEEIIEKIEQQPNTFGKLDIYFEEGKRAADEYSPAFLKDLYESPYLMEVIAAYKKKTTLKILMDILEEGAKKGEIREVDQSFIIMLLDLISAGMMQLMHLYDEERMVSFNQWLTNFLKQGLMTPKGE